MKKNTQGEIRVTDGDRQKLNNLICAVAKGYADCLDGIYAIAGKRMYVAAYAVIGERLSAEDVVSDSFVKIARFAKKYDGTGDPLAWIMKIVRNTALDFIRKRRRRAEVSTEEFYSLTDDSYSPEKRETAVMLEQAMAALEPDERRAIYMRYFLEMTVREIAEATKLSRSAAERLIQRAEENLRKKLGGGTKDADKTFKK